MSRLPNNKARSPFSIKLFLIKSSSITPALLTLQPERIQEFKPIVIHDVEKFTEHESRHSDPRYEVDADITGNVIGRVKKITEKKITIDRVVTYQDDVNDFFDIGAELIDQTQSFAIVKIETAPKDSGVATKITMFLGCYIHSLPKNYELGRELKVVQSIEVGYTQKVPLAAGTIA